MKRKHTIEEKKHGMNKYNTSTVFLLHILIATYCISKDWVNIV